MAIPCAMCLGAQHVVFLLRVTCLRLRPNLLWRHRVMGADVSCGVREVHDARYQACHVLTHSVCTAVVDGLRAVAGSSGAVVQFVTQHSLVDRLRWASSVGVTPHETGFVLCGCGVFLCVAVCVRVACVLLCVHGGGRVLICAHGWMMMPPEHQARRKSANGMQEYIVGQMYHVTKKRQFQSLIGRIRNSFPRIPLPPVRREGSTQADVAQVQQWRWRHVGRASSHSSSLRRVQAMKDLRRERGVLVNGVEFPLGTDRRLHHFMGVLSDVIRTA